MRGILSPLRGELPQDGPDHDSVIIARPLLPENMIQISAAQEALRTVGRELMRNHLRHCVTKAVAEGPTEQANAM